MLPTASGLIVFRAAHDIRRWSAEGRVWRGVAWHGVAWHGVAWRGVACYGVAWRGMAWYGVAWRGVAWRGVGGLPRYSGGRVSCLGWAQQIDDVDEQEMTEMLMSKSNIGEKEVGWCILIVARPSPGADVAGASPVPV